MSENVEARSLVAAAAPSSARSASGGPVHASSVLARDGVQAPGSPPSVACVSRVPQPDSLGAACSRGTDPLVPLSTASVDAHRESSQFGTLAADTLPHQQLQTLSTATLMKSAPVQQSETWALSPLTQPDARCEPRDAKQTQATTVPNSASEEPADKGRPCLHDVVEAHAVHESESISSFAEHSRSKEAIASSETINEVVTDITVQGMEQSQMIVAMSGAMEEADPQAESMRVDVLDVADCPSQQHSGFVPCTTALGCGEGSHFCADATLPGHLSLSAMKPTVPSTACDIAAMQELEFAPLTMPSYSGESDAIIDVSVRIPISRNMAATADDVARHEHGALEFPVIGLADVVKTDSNIEVIGTVVNSNVGLSDEVDGSMTCAYPAQRAESASDDQASKNNVFDSTAENNLEASDALDNQMLALHVDSSLDCTERTTACGIVMEEVGVGIVRDMPEELEGRDLAFSEHANERKARQMNSGIKLSDADAEASDSCAVEAKTDTRCPTVNHIFKFRHSAESEVDTVIYDDSCDAPEKEPAELHPVDPSLSLTQLADSGKMPSCGMSDSNPVVLNTNSTFVTHREPLSESAKAKNIEEYGVIPVALVIPPTHIDKEKVVGLTTFKPNNLESMEKEAARSLTTDLLVMNVEAQEISIPQGFSLAITVPLLPHEFDKSRNEEAGQDVFAASKFQSAAKQTLATKNASNSEQLSLPIVSHVARALSNSTSGKSPLAPRPALFKKPFKVPFKVEFSEVKAAFDEQEPIASSVATSVATLTKPPILARLKIPAKRKAHAFKPPARNSKHVLETTESLKNGDSILMTHKNAPNLLKELNLTEREFSMLVRQDSEIRSLLFKRAELERSISAISDDISKVEAAERLSKSKEPEKIQSLLMKWKEACRLALVEVRDLLGPRLQEPYQDDWNKRRKVDIDEESDEEVDEEEEEEEEECKGWAAFLAKVPGFEQAGKVRTSVEKEEHIAQELIEGAVGISVDAGHRAEGGLWNLKELGLKLGIDVLALGYYDIDADCFD